MKQVLASSISRMARRRAPILSEIKGNTVSIKSWLKSVSKRSSVRNVANDRRRRSLTRQRLLEQLEQRFLLASDWHNQFIANDVNDDFRVSAIDALMVINKLATQGGLPLPTLAQGTRPDAYYDTNEDGFVTAVDALSVINDISLGKASAGPTNPRLIDVVPVDGTTILASFDRPMGASAIDPSNYNITNENGQAIEVLGAYFGEGESVVQLQTSPQTSSSYTVNIQNVADRLGQTVFFEGRKITGNPKGAIVSAAATSPTRVVIVFNEPIADNALAPQNYHINDVDGQSLLVTDAKFDGPLGMVVILTTQVQAAKPYRVTVSSVTDLQNDQLQTTVANFQGISGRTKLNAATPDGPNSILLNYSQPMSDDALTPSSYVIKNSLGVALPVTDAQFVGTERRLVHLETGPQTTGIYTIQSIIASDFNGNLVAPPGTAGIFQGVPAPSLIAAIPSDSTHVFLTFGSPVSDSSLSPSSYKLEKLDSQGNVVSILPISEAVFVGSQRTVVSLTTPHQSIARFRITTTDGLSDVTGSPLAIAAVEFQGIGSLPKVTNVTSTGPTSMLVTFNVPMSDDVLTPASYVINNLSGMTLPVNNVQFVGTDRRLVELTTGSQVAGTYTIASIAATDLGGTAVNSPGSAGDFQGNPAPTLSKATPADATHLVLVFSGPVGDSALAPSSYKIEQVDILGNVIGSLAINTATFVGDQRTVVSLTTPYQSDSRYQISTTSALADSTGSPLAIVQQQFQGIGQSAALVGITSTDPTTLQVVFNVPLSDDALQPSLYVIHDSTGAPLPIYSAQFIGTERRLVQLTTGPQSRSETYTVVSIGATDLSGNTTTIPTSVAINTFPGPGNSGGNSVPVDGPPRMVGAASLGNTSVLVAFSEPMDDNALNPAHYFIVQQSINPEVGYVPILGAAFYSSDHRSVVLTTGSQNELTYSITAVNVTDQSGSALAAAVIAGQQRIDPTTALFPGTPPSGAQIVDTDGDGLSDNVEVRGWTVTVTRLDGSTFTREVTSDPNDPDTDGDALWDAQELNIGTDPRSVDTDGDQLNDWAEFNEIYTDPTNQDSDGDSLDDFLEFSFFKTSPYLADSDGDQMTDDYEIFANRNPRVSDLPRPEITVGEVNLQLDVQFTETSDQQRRDLETKSVTSTLTRSASQTFARSDTVNVEAHLEVGLGDGSTKINAGPYIRAGGSVGYSFSQSSESTTAAEQAYESSLSTDREVTRGFTVERVVQGAVMQVAIDLRNLSSLAYRVQNLQVTAFIQDPQDHSKLTPVATLLPDSEPDEGFTLGPLSPQKGPFIFSNDSIVPRLVESLMANSSGLIFRISNYDIIDETGRNFAFTSQEIVERTSRLVVDYGGASSLRALLGGEAFDELQPGDETEIFRVATSAGQVIDTNFDGIVDGNDRRAIYDADGKEVGITLFEALAAAGLKRYQEATTPTGSLSDTEILSSYSTFVAPAEVIGGISYPAREKIYRIRGISNDAINQKYWEILTPLGIDQATDVNDLILKTDSPVSLNFVQDLDKDQLSADVEFFLRTSDSALPFGAEIPGITDFKTDMSVSFSTDPGFVTGAIVRVTATGSGLTAGVNYFIRNLGGGSYSFYTSANTASAGGPTGRFLLTDKIRAGVFTAAKPIATDTTAGVMSVSFAAMPVSTDFATNESVSFGTDPEFFTGASVQVTTTGGGLTAGTSYFVRNLSGPTYAFYDSAANASAASASTAGRINLSRDITAGILRTADRSFPTGTMVQLTTDSGGLVAGVNYFIRNLGEGAYSFYNSALNATAGSAVKTGLVPLTGDVTAGIFSPTAKGRDTDGDGLDDRFEALVGWTVNTPQRTYQVYSSPNRADSNFDAPKPGVDSDGDGIEDRLEYSGSDFFAAPAGWEDKRSDTNGDGVIDEFDAPANGLRDRFEIFQLATQSGELDYVLDPSRKDTDSDGINDGTEIIGFKITPITGGKSFWVNTNPTNPFTDSDTFSDGLERLLGLDPTNGADTDEDGDGLPDQVETLGWTVFAFEVSTMPYVQGTYAPGYDQHVTPTSTDIFTNAVKFVGASDPNVPRFTLVQVTGGGLAANNPYYLGRLVDQPDPNSVRYSLYLAATDAAGGTSKGASKLTSPITDIQLAREFNSVAPSSTDVAADAVRFLVANDPNVSPFTRIQVSGGGLVAGDNYFLGKLVDQPDPTIVRYSFYVAASDAAAGTPAGSLQLTSPVTAIRLPAESHKTSRTDAVDSDGDGLTDYEEFFLGTDPSSADSDHDGIEDRIEYLGFTLGHNVGGKDLGYIKTNPLDADTDNDKRSDGSEAELVDIELDRWVVRVVDETPYQVFSNPLVADADFDSLVDGEEFLAGTDPAKGNTDGDKRSDDVEVRSGTNPLAADVQVTIVAQTFNNSASKFTYGLSVRKPDQTGLGMAGLSPTATPILSGNTAIGTGVGKIVVHMGSAGFVGRVYYVYLDAAGNEVGTDSEGDLLAHQTATYNPGLKGVPVGATFRIGMSAVAGNSNNSSQWFTFTGTDTEASFNSGGTTLNHYLDYTGITGDFVLGQTVSFGLATGEHFSIEGFFTNTVTSQTVLLGGLLGIAAKQLDAVSGDSKDIRSIFAYDDVVTKFIEDYRFEYTTADGSIATLKLFFIVG